MKRFVPLLLIALTLTGIALIPSPAIESQAEAGIFSRIAARREARGAPTLAPRLHAAALARSGFGCAGMSSGCGGAAAAVVYSNACTSAACDAAAAQAFANAIPYEAPDAVAANQAFVEALPAAPAPPTPLNPSDTVRVPAAQSSAIPLPDPSLAAKEARLTVLQKIVFNRLKVRPDLRKAVAAYGQARGFGTIDPNNLAQILQVLLAFFQQLWAMILNVP